MKKSALEVPGLVSLGARAVLVNGGAAADAAASPWGPIADFIRKLRRRRWGPIIPRQGAY